MDYLNLSDSEFEAFLRREFERQHAGRRLERHHLRGTYVSAPIAALWNQHLRTAQWLRNLALSSQ